MGFRPGMAKGPSLSRNTGGGGASNPWTLAATIAPPSATYFPADNSTIDQVLVAIPANTVLEAIRVVTTVAFVDATATYLRARFGVFGTLDLYTDYFDIKAINSRKLAWVFDENNLAGWNLRIGLTSDDTLGNFTAGSMSVWLKYWTLP